MYDAPVALLDAPSLDAPTTQMWALADDPPTVRLPAVVDIAWPTVDHDEVIADAATALATSTTPTLPLLEEVLAGLLRYL